MCVKVGKEIPCFFRYRVKAKTIFFFISVKIFTAISSLTSFFSPLLPSVYSVLARILEEGEKKKERESDGTLSFFFSLLFCPEVALTGLFCTIKRVLSFFFLQLRTTWISHFRHLLYREYTGIRGVHRIYD